jgi:hypothetical protein
MNTLQEREGDASGSNTFTVEDREDRASSLREVSQPNDYISLSALEQELAAAEQERNTLREQERRRILTQRIRELREESAQLRRSATATPEPNSIERERSRVRESVECEGDVPAAPPKRRRADTEFLPIRSPRPEKLKEYRGKTVKEWKRFKEDGETTFELSPEYFVTEEQKILFTSQSLEGDPRESWYAHKRNIQLGDYTWADFLSYLLSLIGDPTNRLLLTGQDLEEAKQKPDQSVQNFANYLERLEEELGLLDSPNRWITFYTKLRPDLRASLAQVQSLPRVRNDLVALAARMEQGAKMEIGSKKGNTSKASPQSKQNAGVSSTACKPPFRNNTWKKGDSTPSTPELGRSKVTCYNCGEEGHTYYHCPKPKKDKGKQNIGAAHAKSTGKAEGPARNPHRQDQNTAQ